MSTLTVILSILAVLFLTALPFIKKFLDKVGISVTEKQVELLKKIVEDADRCQSKHGMHDIDTLLRLG